MRSSVPTLFAFDGVGRRLVLALKYGDRRRLVAPLARALVRLVPRDSVDVVTWPPTTGKRRRSRGYDQAELLARALAWRLGVPCRRLLARVGEGHQTGRTRDERLVAAPAFVARRRVRGRVLVVDDVVTTGATMASAMEALRAAGATEVLGVAVAGTP